MPAKVKVAFQGEIGAYSEEAAIQFFGTSIEIIPYRDLPAVFEAMEKGKVEFGIVPIENSLEGSVNQTYDLLLASEVKICNEVILRVSHCLIGSPNAEIGSIKFIYSHPQALAQCRDFLKKLKIEAISVYDTAGSVKVIKKKGWQSSAAIASKRAAEAYQMKILAERVEDNPNNYTRFVVLSKKDSPPTGNDKTSMVFSIKQVPGSLLKVLSGLAEQNINLTKLESRPIVGKPWEYNFHLDFEGHRCEERVKKAVETLKRNSIFVKLLGSYPKAK